MTTTCAPITTDDLPELAHLCAAALPLDPFTPDLLEKRIYRDTRYEPDLTIGLIDNDRLRAAVAGVIRHDPDNTRCGWIKLLAVDPACQHQGLGSRLIKTIEERFHLRQVTRIDTVGHPCYFWPGVDVRYTPVCCLFESLGFTEHRYLTNMAVDLVARDFEPARLAQQLADRGYTLARADAAAAHDITALINRHWPIWAHETAAALANKPVSMFYVRHNQRVVAYAAYDIEMFPGTFGSMGTDPDHRNRGIGEALLHACLHDMQQKGYTRCEIAWVGPVAFYARHAGATICRVFRDYRKTLTPER